MSNTARTSFRDLHTTCGCVIDAEPASAGGSARLQKDDCELAIENLVIALDCDLCDAFTRADVRPDIISIRRCGGQCGWLVIEMKKTMRERAAVQARAALERLEQVSMFRAGLEQAHVVFVVKNRRKSDNTIMRKIGVINAGRWSVVPRLINSRDTIRCA